MTAPPLTPARAPSQRRALRRLFLTLFLRGRSARDLKKESAPQTVAAKLTFTLLMYALGGCLALMLLRQPVFALSLYMHGMTLVFLGMFIASAAGEILFNKEESDILLHRPVTPRALLWAKIGVLVEVSLWLAGAFNLAGMLGGMARGAWMFPVAHIFSTALEALFCASCVVLVYQLCLRWFGRERLDGLMTTAQVGVSVAAVLAGQIIPRVMGHLDKFATFGPENWWIVLLPPAWFAGMDDLLLGHVSGRNGLLAGIGLTATITIVGLAFGKMARDYGAGLQTVNEAPALRRSAGQGRWLSRLVKLPLLRWWLRDPVVRASFLLTGAYMFRDRDVRLRLYPGLAPMALLPVLFLFQGAHSERAGDATWIGLSGAYLCLMPLMALTLLQHSQQWQAADIFRVVPVPGPARICEGARRAVLLLLTFPLLLALGALTWIIGRDLSPLKLLLPGVIALPIFALMPHLNGKAVPLSQATEESKSAERIGLVIVSMICAAGLSVLANLAESHGWYFLFLVLEVVVVAVAGYFMKASINKVRWKSAE